ncbi:MAG: protein kinase, partial [Rhodospirillaceae bacterium]|nr:protein kinase [Rhodospirillaceae bacterium]
RGAARLGPLAPGTAIGAYRIEALLSGGPESLVYRAGRGDGRAVVLKEYAPSAFGYRAGESVRPHPGMAALFAERRRRFSKEAEALAALDSPRLPRFLDAFSANGTDYIAMEAIGGPTLAARMTGGPPLGEAELLGLINEVGAGLANLHGARLLHRDVKPANIVLDPMQGAVLVDLGAVAALDASTGPGAPSYLTPGYGAPEQYVDDGDEGPWTDIYGLAALAYRAVAGVAPTAASERLQRDDMAPAEVLGRGRFSSALLDAIDRGLALAPDRRPRTMANWLKALPMTDPVPPTGPQAAASADIPPTVAVERRPAPPPPVRPAGLTRPRAQPAKARGRRWGLVAGLVLLLLVAVALALFGPDYYRKNIKSEWLVDAAGGGDTESIADALRDAKADAIVTVRPGTYRESVALVRPVSLIGAPDAPETVIVAPETGVCLASAVERGLISGIAFQGVAAPEAEKAENPPPCVVTSAGALRLDRTQIRGADGPALLITGEAAPTVTNSSLFGGAGSALVVDRGAGEILENEIVGGAGSAVVLRAGADPLLRENRISGGDSAAVLATAGARGRIEMNTIQTPLGSGIEVRRGADSVVTGNRIEGAGEAGIFVHQRGRGTFSDNTVIASGFSGVVIGAGAAPVMTTNVIEGNGEHGVLLLDGAAGRLERNVIRDNAGHGIASVTGALTEMADNEVEGNLDPQIQEGLLVVAPNKKM